MTPRHRHRHTSPLPIGRGQRRWKPTRPIKERAVGTYRNLAHHADLDFSYINQLENGKRNPSLETLYKIATALEVPVKDLISD
ncbi:MAG TPA: helix-turn-helix transcriptional regulator [Chloroflexota bacterium]|nr:helix-turn-helix transcriptional regulator [Chloroflexota bacterium]